MDEESAQYYSHHLYADPWIARENSPFLLQESGIPRGVLMGQIQPDCCEDRTP